MFNCIVDPDQLRVISEVFHAHCQKHGIDPASPKGEAVAHRVMALFTGGAKSLLDLERALDPPERRSA